MRPEMVFTMVRNTQLGMFEQTPVLPVMDLGFSLDKISADDILISYARPWNPHSSRFA